MTIHDQLNRLYDSTADDLRYGIGVLDVPDIGRVPFVQIRYRDWTREQLDAVRESFRRGLSLTRTDHAGCPSGVYIGTREQITVQGEHGGHTSVLRAPAWDAQLDEVDEQIFQQFDAARRRHRGFVLQMQTNEWGFITTVDDAAGTAEVGDVFRCRAVPSNDHHVA